MKLKIKSKHKYFSSIQISKNYARRCLSFRVFSTKYKKAKVSLPGGCAIGTRPVDLHLHALKKLGAKIKIKDGYIFAEAKNGLVGQK